jgi:hypothetical protein
MFETEAWDLREQSKKTETFSNNKGYLAFEIFTMTVMKSSIFWVIMSLVH